MSKYLLDKFLFTVDRDADLAGQRCALAAFLALHAATDR